MTPPFSFAACVAGAVQRTRSCALSPRGTSCSRRSATPPSPSTRFSSSGMVYIYIHVCGPLCKLEVCFDFWLTMMMMMMQGKCRRLKGLCNFKAIVIGICIWLWKMLRGVLLKYCAFGIRVTCKSRCNDVNFTYSGSLGFSRNFSNASQE